MASPSEVQASATEIDGLSQIAIKRKAPFQRGGPMPPVQPEKSVITIINRVFSPQFEVVLDFVQMFTKLRAPLARA
jgi:hypothetical protein